MLLARKLTSAFRLLRQRGPGTVGDVARIRMEALYRDYRPIPSDAVRRARLLDGVINRWSGLSRVPIDRADASAVRDAVLLPYLRHRFAETAAVAAQLGDPTPVEVAVMADAMLAAWAFPSVAEAETAWARAVAGTKFTRRIAQIGRWAALRLGRLDDAARPVAGDPDDIGALLLRADVSDARGEMAEAHDAYTRAIRCDGADPHARLSFGFHLMKSGRVLDGLAEWLTSDTVAGNYPLRRQRPRWTGEAIGARRLMILFEHGLGDMIQVSRFLPRLQNREPEAIVTARVPAALIGLMRREFPNVAFFTEDDREPDCDLFIPSMHLASALSAADLQPSGRYIELGDPITAAGSRPRVGVCWRGHPRQYEFTRSIPLPDFAELFANPDVSYVVLLNRLTAEESAFLARRPEVETPPIADFVDLAAVIASCDLVVSVDTAVVHLAAAGGKPVLLMSRPDACWRWGAAGPASPWYDHVEVLRHDRDIDWPRMLDVVKDRLRVRYGAPAAAVAGLRFDDA